MSTSQLRRELHDFINQADERVLRLIYGMMKADLEESDNELTDAHREILDQRLADHKGAPDKGSPWESVKARIQKNK